jgi:hypothetical protein
VGVAFGTAIPHAILVLGLLPILISRKLGMPVRRYFTGIFGRLAWAALPFALGALAVREYWPARNLLEFFAQVALLCLVYGAAVYLIALDPEERATLRRMLPAKLAPKAP